MGVTPIENVDGDLFPGEKTLNAEAGSIIVISPKPNRTRQISCDFHTCHGKRQAENLFSRRKAFRDIAKQYDKTDQSCRAAIRQVATALARNRMSAMPSSRGAWGGPQAIPGTSPDCLYR